MSVDVAWYRRTGQIRHHTRPSFVGLPGSYFSGSSVFWWVASPPHIVVGAGPTVTLFHNTVSPGTFDGVVLGSLTYSPGGFVDGRNCATLDGATNRIRTTGLAVPVDQRPDFYGVARYGGAIPPGAIEVWFLTFSGCAQIYEHTVGSVQATTFSNPAGTVSNFLGAQSNNAELRGVTFFDGRASGWRNGVETLNAAGQVGNQFGFGAVNFGATSGGGLNWTGDFAEFGMNLNDPNGSANRLRYQNERVKRLYPSIPLP